MASAIMTSATERHSDMSVAAPGGSAAVDVGCGCASRPVGPVTPHLPLLPAIALALLPKCPLCLGAWFGFLGAFGAGSWLGSAWQTPLGFAFVSIALAPLLLRARRVRDPRPLLLGAMGGAALLWGRYAAESFLLCAGLGVLMAASLWSSGFFSRLQTGGGGPRPG
jgi:hypothetical protein